METAQIAESDSARGSEEVVRRVLVKVGVKARADRQTEAARREQGGPPQRTLGGHMDDVRPRRRPAMAEPAADRQANPQRRVEQQGQPRHEPVPRIARRGAGIGLALSRPDHFDGVTAPGEPSCQPIQRHRDAVDLRQVRFGDKGEFQAVVRER